MHITNISVKGRGLVTQDLGHLDAAALNGALYQVPFTLRRAAIKPERSIVHAQPYWHLRAQVSLQSSWTGGDWRPGGSEANTPADL